MSCSRPTLSLSFRIPAFVVWLAGCFVALLAGCSEPSTASTKVASVSCQLDSDCNYPNARCNSAKATCYTLGCDVLCPVGQTCDPLAKKCVVPSSSGDASGTKDGGDAGSTTDASVTDGSSDQDATAGTDAESPDDTGPTTPGDKSCAACKADADCGADFQCISLISGSFCARKCSTGTDCAPGYKCEQASSDPKNTQTYCVLPSFDCSGCAGDPKGCPSGQKCNVKVGTPTCVAVKQQCEACNQDVDCDNGLRCVKQGDAKVCSPDCSNGKACPANSTCQVFFGIPACAFKADKCCFGSTCQVSTACSGCAADKCIGGQCVECVKDADCTGGSCNVAVHSCVKTVDCSGDKPIKLAATGECVECSNDTHCASSSKGPKCDPSAHTCGKGTQNTECAACGGAYPGCVEINGTWSCVECSTDKDCADKGKGTCSGKTYTCSGTVGTGTGPSTGTCKADSDCQNGPSTTFTLACDTKSGLCYDTKGSCDNVVAFCNAAEGSSCVPLLDLGAGGGLPPGLPGGGGGGSPLPNQSVCSCGGGSSGGGSGSTMKQECQLLAALDPNLKKCDCAKDPNDPNCKNAILGACCTAGTSGGTGGAGNPLQCLLAGQGSASAACFGGNCSTTLNCFFGKPGGTCGSGGLF